MLYKLCLFNTKTLCFFSLLRVDFSMKNRNLPPRFKLAEFVGVQKNKTKKRIQQTAGRTRGRLFFFFKGLVCLNNGSK